MSLHDEDRTDHSNPEAPSGLEIETLAGELGRIEQDLQPVGEDDGDDHYPRT